MKGLTWPTSDKLSDDGIARQGPTQYFYASFLEQLKQADPISVGDAAADEAADKVVERMKALGFTSATLPEPSGGLPERKSPRPWKGVMKWLLGLIRKVGRFLANSIWAFGLLAGRLFVNAVNQISVGFSAGFLWGSKTGHRWLTCEYANRDGRWAGKIAGL